MKKLNTALLVAAALLLLVGCKTVEFAERRTSIKFLGYSYESETIGFKSEEAQK